VKQLSKGLLSFTLSVVSLLVCSNGAFASGAPGDPEPSLGDVYLAVPHGPNDSGYMWTISTNPSSSYIARRIGLLEGSYQQWTMCSSLTATECSPIAGASLESQVVLGHCLNDAEIACIEKLTIIDQSGIEEELVPEGHAGPETVFAEDTLRGLPRGSSYPIWRARDQTRFIMSNKIEFGFSVESGSWSARPGAVEFALRRASSYGGISGPVASLLPSPNDSSLSTLSFNSLVADFVLMDPADQLVATIRLPSSLTGWLHGRFTDASVSQVSGSASTTNSISYRISGKPAVSNIAGGWVDWSSQPSLRQSFFGPTFTPSPGTFGFEVAGSSMAVEKYRLAEALFGQRNIMERLQWSFRSASSGNLGACASSLRGLQGVISTNAAVYNDSVPRWNSDTGNLEIEVGSPHLTSTGQQSVGTYSASLPVSLVKCLWQLDDVPTRANVGVDHSDSTDEVFSVSVIRDFEWLSVSAKGFHFSTPTLGLSFLEGNGCVGVTSNSGSVGRISTGFSSLAAPVRLMDNRGSSKIGSTSGGAEWCELQVSGRAGIPSSAGAVALNVTATNTEANAFGGFVTVYPCGSRPDASNLNFSTGQSIANSVIAPLSSDGKVCFYVYGSSHLLVDVSGFFTSGFDDLLPARLLDTRSGIGAPVGKVGQVDGSGTPLTLQITGRGGVPSSATAAALNVTAVNTSTNDFGGYVTVYPCGSRPEASNLNFLGGMTVPNLVMAPLSSTGTVCLYVYGRADLLVDVSGYFTSGFEDLVPERVLDTRNGVGAPVGRIGEINGTGEALTLQVTGRGGVPTNATAAALNVTAVNTSTNQFGGYVTVYPCGSRPEASNLNFVAGATVPNMVMAPLSSTGTVCLYVYGRADLLVDVSGYFAA